LILGAIFLFGFIYFWFSFLFSVKEVFGRLASFLRFWSKHARAADNEREGDLFFLHLVLLGFSI
jgi:hypothetical protein